MGSHIAQGLIANVALAPPAGAPFWPWTGILNMKEFDVNFAEMLNSTPVVSDDALLQDYGFVIPDGAIIVGIKVRVYRKCSDAAVSHAVDNKIRLLKAGAEVGDDKADIVTKWPLAQTLAEYGGDTDLWGTTWTASEINDPTFGVVLAAEVISGFPVTPEVNVIQLEIHYLNQGEDFMGFFG
jgi:hypothetical protein